MPSENVTLEGHILDTLALPRTMDEIVEAGATYEILCSWVTPHSRSQAGLAYNE